MKVPVKLPGEPTDEVTKLRDPETDHLDERSARSIRILVERSQAGAPDPGDWPDHGGRQEPVTVPSRPDQKAAFKLPDLKSGDEQ